MSAPTLTLVRPQTDPRLARPQTDDLARPQTDDAVSEDGALLLRARAGDPAAIGSLWNRHSAVAKSVARQVTSSIDADDLVAEAFARIWADLKDGKGPHDDFRPYLFSVVRNLAHRWGRSRREISADYLDDFELEAAEDPAETRTFDRSLVLTAFTSLPERWQTILWYSEIEGLSPRDIAPLMGMTANTSAALAYRAKEGLRKAWLQAHVTSAQSEGECAWVTMRLGDHTRHGLSARDTKRVAAHLAECPSCSDIAVEVEEVGSRLAIVLLPLGLGGGAGIGWLALGSGATSAQAASGSGLASWAGAATVAKVASIAVVAGALVVPISSSAPIAYADPEPATPSAATEQLVGAMPAPIAETTSPVSSVMNGDSLRLPVAAATSAAGLTGATGGLLTYGVNVVDRTLDGTGQLLYGTGQALAGTIDQTLTSTDQTLDRVGEVAVSVTAPTADTVLAPVAPVVDPALSSAVTPLAGGVLDPVLDPLLGISVGELLGR